MDLQYKIKLFVSLQIIICNFLISGFILLIFLKFKIDQGFQNGHIYVLWLLIAIMIILLPFSVHLINGRDMWQLLWRQCV